MRAVPELADAELVVHFFAAVDGPDADQVYGYLLDVWRACRRRLGMERPVTAPHLGVVLPAEPPAQRSALVGDGPVALTERARPGVFQAVLRRVHDVICLSVVLAPAQDEPVNWADLDRQWTEVAGQPPEAVLGAARIYQACLAEPGEPQADATAAAARRYAAGLPPGGTADWPERGVTTSAGFAVWELDTEDDARLGRRLLVVVPADRDPKLSAWTWSRGDLAMTPFARYLLHAAKVRYEMRVWDGGRYVRELRAQSDILVDRLVATFEEADSAGTVAAVARDDAGPLVERLDGQIRRLTFTSTALREMQNAVDIAIANMGAVIGHDVLEPTVPGLFSDDRTLAAWLEQRLAGDRAVIASVLARAEAAGQQRRLYLMGLLQALAAAPTPRAAREFIDKHPVLITAETNEAFGGMIAMVGDKVGLAARFESQRLLLRRCREIGVDDVFAEAFPTKFGQPGDSGGLSLGDDTFSESLDDIAFSKQDLADFRRELARTFDTELAADQVLTEIGYEKARRVAIDSSTPDIAWSIIFKELSKGAVTTPFRRLLAATIRGYPGNETFRRLSARHGLVEIADLAPRPVWRQDQDAGQVEPVGLPHVLEPPHRLLTFVGRRKLLDEIDTRLARRPDGSTCPLVLHGLSGIGKTQLAAEYAHRRADLYRMVCWIDASQPALVADKIAMLAVPLGLSATGRVPEGAAAVVAALRRRARWLLIFDGVPNPDQLLPWLPGGDGHVLMTSRSAGSGRIAEPMQIDVLDRTESTAILTRRLRAHKVSITDSTADAIAAELGDLPLALEQAAAYIARTHRPDRFIERFRAQRRAMLAKLATSVDRGPLIQAADTVWNHTFELTFDEISVRAPAAAQLLELCAFLSSAPIPLTMVERQADLLDEPLRNAASGADPVDDIDDVVSALLDFSMVRRDGDTVTLHPLVQAVILARMPADRRPHIARQIQGLLAHMLFGDPTDPKEWHASAGMAGHVKVCAENLAVPPAVAETDAFRRRIIDICRYLYASGQYQASREFSQQMYDRWRTALGPDHLDTLVAAKHLASSLRALGGLRPARLLAEATLHRSRVALGMTHPHSLAVATDVVRILSDLGEHEAARDLAEETLARCRRQFGDNDPASLAAATNLVRTLFQLGDRTALAMAEALFLQHRRALGSDHPGTLTMEAGLAVNLHALGVELGVPDVPTSACDLAEDTLRRRRAVLGADHPDTLTSAGDVANIWSSLGRAREALDLDLDTLARRRRTLGPDHPDTLESANNVAAGYLALNMTDNAWLLASETHERCRTALGDDHPVTRRTTAANLHGVLRDSLLRADRNDKA